MEVMFGKVYDRRLYTRSWCRVYISVYYNDTFLKRCYTFNLSVGGMLIDACEMGLPENTLIQISFEVDNAHCLFGVRIPAVVLRNDDHFIAVSFETLEKGTEELLSSNYLSHYPLYS